MLYLQTKKDMPGAQILQAYTESLNKKDLYNSRANPKLNDGQKNFQKALMRHGGALYFHIMKASADPVYGRDMSIAQQYERPATNFPLAEDTRPHERSENMHLPIMYRQDSNKSLDALFPHTNPKERPYSDYKKPRYNNVKYLSKFYNPQKKKGPGKDEYKISSIVESLEKKAKQYFKKFYNSNSGKVDNIKKESAYEGIAKKVSYAIEKLKSYAQEQVYNSKPEEQRYNGYRIGYMLSLPSYVLPIGYSENDSKHHPIKPSEYRDMPTLEEFMKLSEIKRIAASKQESLSLETRVLS